MRGIAHSQPCESGYRHVHTHEVTFVDDRNGLGGPIDRCSTVVAQRSPLGAAVADALAEAVPCTAGPVAETGASAGARCGKENQPSCRTGCSRFTERRPNTGGRRCTRRPDFKRCNRPDQCHSSICRASPCAGFDEPVYIPGFFRSPAARVKLRSAGDRLRSPSYGGGTRTSSGRR